MQTRALPLGYGAIFETMILYHNKIKNANINNLNIEFNGAPTNTLYRAKIEIIASQFILRFSIKLCTKKYPIITTANIFTIKYLQF